MPPPRQNIALVNASNVTHIQLLTLSIQKIYYYFSNIFKLYNYFLLTFRTPHKPVTQEREK